MSTPESLHALTAIKPELLSHQDAREGALQPITANKRQMASKRPKRARGRIKRPSIYSRAKARGEWWAELSIAQGIFLVGGVIVCVGAVVVWLDLIFDIL